MMHRGSPGEKDGEKKIRKVLRSWICSQLYGLPSPLIWYCHIYTERITPVFLEFGLFCGGLWDCAMAEQNLFGFILNTQVKWLYLVKALCKNQKGDWIAGCIPAFFPPPPLQTASRSWGKLEQENLELIWESYREREKGLVMEIALTWVLKSTINRNPLAKKPPFGATMLSAIPTDRSEGSLPARGLLWSQVFWLGGARTAVPSPWLRLLCAVAIQVIYEYSGTWQHPLLDFNIFFFFFLNLHLSYSFNLCSSIFF